MSDSVISQELQIIESTIRTVADRLDDLAMDTFTPRRVKGPVPALLREHAERLRRVAERVSVKGGV